MNSALKAEKDLESEISLKKEVKPKTTRRRRTRAKVVKTDEPKAPTVKKVFEFHKITPEELVPDGTELLKFVIPGRPATKKTHQNIIYVRGFPRIVPSKQYMDYEKLCKTFCENAWAKTGKAPMDFGVGISVKIYLDNWIVGDATGYFQSIADILEKWGVIANDSWLHWVYGAEHWLGEIDKVNPRMEITITRHRHPKEKFREEQESAEQKKIAKRLLKPAKI